MTPMFVFVVACGCALLVLSFLALRYPNGRADWGRDRAETASIVASALTFVLLFLLLWYAGATVDWPPAAVIAFWSAAVACAALAVVAVVYPEGLGIEILEKKD